MVLTGDAGYKAGREGVPIEDAPYLPGPNATTSGCATGTTARRPPSWRWARPPAPQTRPARALERTEETAAANVVPLDATGRLTGGQPFPRAGRRRSGNGRQRQFRRQGPRNSTRRMARRKRWPCWGTTNGVQGRPGRAAAYARAETNGGAYREALQLTGPRRRGRPSRAEAGGAQAVAPEAGERGFGGKEIITLSPWAVEFLPCALHI